MKIGFFVTNQYLPNQSMPQMIKESVEQVRLAMMVINTAQSKPETIEEIMAQVEKIIKTLKLDS